ncbi:DsbE family thiol:disulfide interchange protein [Paracoccus jeotgali]|uniref:DsbE family thiol:disulfide interchange protein n=1 Tax=Paracoccus jeotgali TaxID=2065379 RepID=UPI0028AB4505|nr:DsbE family thiol:disulfide interchange protein [Paracoccus jeotgali]
MRVKPLMLLPPVLFLALALTFWWGMQREDPNNLPSTMIGREAPSLPETALNDNELLTAEMLRQPGVKLVNFWASWCPPCRAEHPTLMSLARDMPVYGVDLKDNPDDAQRFLDKDGNPYAAIAADPRGRAAIDWGVTAPPETFIIDGKGRILHRHAGPLIREDYTNRFLPELQKALAAEK